MCKFVDGMRLHGFVHSEDEDVQVLLRMIAKSSKRGTLSFIDNACYSEVVPPAAPVPALRSADIRQLVCDSISHVTTMGPSCITSLTTAEHLQLSMICQHVLGDAFYRLGYVCESFVQLTLQRQIYGTTES